MICKICGKGFSWGVDPAGGDTCSNCLAKQKLRQKEPTIVINGKTLTQGQAMTLRVAANSFRMELGTDDALGDDDHGREMTVLYRDALDYLVHLMLNN